VARVRQLLAQHPLLAVGYSLTDPDFHALYRRTSIHMRGRQPLGLALLVSRPDPASEEYWRNLGILVATLGKGDPATALSGFFGSARPRLKPANLLGLLRPDDTLANRMAILGEYIDDPERARFVDSSPESDEQHLWQAVEGRLEPQRRQELRSVPFRARRKRPATRARDGSEQAEQTENASPPLRHFPSSRFEQSSYPVLVLNEVVGFEATWEGVAAWSRLVFERETLRDPADARFGKFESLVSWIWRQAAEQMPQLRPEAQRIGRACLDYATHYGLPGVDDIRADLTAIGDAPPETAQARAPAAQSEMGQALERSLNGDWGGAEEAYGRALDAAKRARDALGAWIAAFGRAWAAARAQNDTYLRTDSPPPARTQLDEMWAEASALSDVPEVKAWRERAEHRVKEVTKQATERLRDELRDVDRDAQHFYWSNAPHYAWRAWQDLQERAAPADLQRKYLEPILRAGSSKDTAAELGVRLRLETKGTDEWIHDLAADPTRHLDGKLEAAVMGALRHATDQSSSTRTERLQALSLVAPAVELARDSDLSFLETFVTAAQQEFRDRVETPRGTQWPYREQAAAWRAIASANTGDRALARRDAIAGGGSDTRPCCTTRFASWNLS